ncbi:MAG: hypothetical protein HC817_02910 [Saprospiraceae bacterium]|nr:hypothetical protein [Saprospiraceae bacterium]
MKSLGQKLIFTCLILGSQTALLAQNYTTKKTATGKAKAAYEAGMKLNFNNKNEPALKEFTDALKADATFIDAQIQQGAMFYELNRLAEAEQAFEKVLAIDKNYDPKVFYVLGNAELKAEKYEEAAEHFEAYTKSNKTYPELLAKAERAAKNARFVGFALKNPVPLSQKLWAIKLIPLSIPSICHRLRLMPKPSFTLFWLSDKKIFLCRKKWIACGKKANQLLN